MKLVVGLSGVGGGALMTAILLLVFCGDWGCCGAQSVPDLDVLDLWDAEAMQRSLNQRYICPRIIDRHDCFTRYSRRNIMCEASEDILTYGRSNG